MALLMNCNAFSLANRADSRFVKSIFFSIDSAATTFSIGLPYSALLAALVSPCPTIVFDGPAPALPPVSGGRSAALPPGFVLGGGGGDPFAPVAVATGGVLLAVP
jgi:hypothetical protein